MLDLELYPKTLASYRKGRDFLEDGSIETVFESLNRAELIRYLAADLSETVDNTDIVDYGDSGAAWLVKELAQAIENEPTLESYVEPLQKLYNYLTSYEKYLYSDDSKAYVGEGLARSNMKDWVRDFQPRLDEFLTCIENIGDDQLSNTDKSKENDLQKLKDASFDSFLIQKGIDEILRALKHKSVYDSQDRDSVEKILETLKTLKEDIEEAKKQLS